ncbi:MAG TPA: FAD-binding oxidoreductase, partial [Vicinamibacteria bacterium]
MKQGRARFTPNESFWLEAIDRTRLEPPLEGERKADVLCLGGGYTSLVTAYLLKKRNPGMEVAVVEGSYVGFGASGRNGGMALHEPHLGRARKRGMESVRFTYDETVKTIDWIDGLSREEGFDCELERTGYLEIALYPKHERENEAKERACRNAGIELELVDRKEMRSTIRSERFLSALHFPKAAVLHPGKYVSGLKKAALAKGVRLFEVSPVESVADDGRGFEVATPRGRIRAETIVVGLNAYLPAARLGIVRDRAISLFSFILLTEPLSPARWKEIGWAGRQGYSDKRRVHNYVRLTGDRILFGGRVRYHFGLESPKAIESLYSELRGEFLKTFPSLKDAAITHRWCGPVAITWRRTPEIGRTGGNQRAFYALGYSGMGVSLATLSGRVLADLIEGREEHWENLLYLHDPVAPLPPEPFRFLGFEGSYLGMRF